MPTLNTVVNPNPFKCYGFSKSLNLQGSNALGYDTGTVGALQVVVNCSPHYATGDTVAS